MPHPMAPPQVAWGRILAGVVFQFLAFRWRGNQVSDVTILVGDGRC